MVDSPIEWYCTRDVILIKIGDHIDYRALTSSNVEFQILDF
jgi:hypothetical protein